MQSNLFESFGVKKEKNKMEVEEEKEKEKQTPWVEKYRPQKVADICYQVDMVNALKGVVSTGKLPHLLLYGPPGTGKTSSILALAKELWGPQYYRQRVLELNASDDRGIKVVREKIKKFAMALPQKQPKGEYLSPNYKIIILDEADLMTNDAQSALRRIIEDYASSTRFCIICNYITKIITPLASRCIKYQFKPISLEAQVSKLGQISKSEGLTLKTPETLDTLVEVSQGDLRRSVTLLQSVSILFGKTVGSHEIREVSGQLSQTLVDTLLADVLATKSTEDMMACVDSFLMQGYSANQLLSGLQTAVLAGEQLQSSHKCKVLLTIAEVESQLCKGGRDDLQLYYLFSQIVSQ